MIYPNLARDLVVTGVNQLWIADLTYIQLLEEFVFLAAILDAFSRRSSNLLSGACRHREG